MVKIYDEPESPHEGACLRNFCQQKGKHIHGAAGMLSGAEPRGSPQVLALFRHGAKILTHGQKDSFPDFLLPSALTGFRKQTEGKPST